MRMPSKTQGVTTDSTHRLRNYLQKKIRHKKSIMNNKGNSWGRGTPISEWRTSATKHLRHRGLLVTGATKKWGGVFLYRSQIMESFSEIKLITGYKSLKIQASVIVTNQSLGQIIKMMGFGVTKSEIGGLWVTNQKLGVFEWQKIRGTMGGNA